ncbi:MAG: DNA replication and repair protein RecF, partial [Bacilli bacterium]|nr:DNA replication and repair protein RecF [Bacilli bacterium]
LNASIRYRKILKQRNEMLKMIAGNQGYDRILLKILTEQLIKEGTTIINERKKFISALNPLFNNKTKQISSGKEQGVIKYLMNTDIDRLEQVFSQKIVNEIAMQTTLFGPHRDDFEIKINGENAGTFASQGQQRTLLLASKLALTEMLANKDSPLVIILDDVFSELDSARQNQLLSMINRDFQIFITTTSIESLASKLLEHSKIIEIEEEEKL